MQALPTLEDVARCAGTAVATAGRALGGMAKWRLHRFSSPRLQRQHPHAVWPRTGSRYICRRRHRVAEALQHHLEHGLSPREATVKAMKEVSGSVIMIARSRSFSAPCLCLWLSWAESLGSLSAVCYYRRGGCRLLRNLAGKKDGIVYRFAHGFDP